MYHIIIIILLTLAGATQLSAMTVAQIEQQELDLCAQIFAIDSRISPLQAHGIAYLSKEEGEKLTQQIHDLQSQKVPLRLELAKLLQQKYDITGDEGLIDRRSTHLAFAKKYGNVHALESAINKAD